MVKSLVHLEKISMRERVGRALRAAIVSGEMEAGVVYSAPSLGARFGVSATPVREAMLDLVREEFVEIVPNKGFRVTTVSEADLDQITELRLLIEPPMTAKVTPLIPEADFAGLRALADDIVAGAQAGDLVAYTEADRVFHLELLGYAGNARVSSLIGQLRGNTRLLGLSRLREAGELIDSAREHYDLLDIIVGRDAAAAQAAMHAHISHVRGRWAEHGS